MMLSFDRAPIVAIATAPGRAAVGIIRVSGCGLAPWIKKLLGKELKAREATLLAFPDDDGQPLDKGLAIFFPAPNSFTGEDVLELQAHGSTVVLHLLLARCISLAQLINPESATPWLAGLRLAQPGEFTLRAFLNNKIDLAQAEAIADLVAANTEAAARSASRALCGAFSNAIHVLRDRLVQLRTLVEATLDFPDEELDFLKAADARGQLHALQAAVSEVLSKARQGALLQEGISVVLAGQPNVGKSSLLNALAGAELAIVTAVPGTTRDKIEQTIQISGVPIRVVDTAGLRLTLDEVERVGVARAWDAIRAADVVLFLHDLTRCQAPDYIAGDAEIGHSMNSVLRDSVPCLHVWNKCDVAAVPEGMQVQCQVSTRTGQGLEALRTRLLDIVGWQPTLGGDVFTARTRHLQALKEVQVRLVHADGYLADDSAALDLLAEELRVAQLALNSITGEFGTEDLLGAIFSEFCIGK